MSSKLKHPQLSEFKPRALKTFDSNRQGIQTKQLSIELKLNSSMRIRVARPTP